MLYEHLIRPLLFRLDPETAHRLSLRALGLLNRSAAARRRLRTALLPPDPRLSISLFGQTLPHPIGLAAGFDKNARVVPALFALGFSFVEIGAVSSYPEGGSPRPRLFRLPEEESLINRMGLPNDGAGAVARHLAAMPAPDGLLGANIVKPRRIPAGSPGAIEAYAHTLARLFPFVHYFSINVSSPSSPDLRTLAAPATLRRLLDRLSGLNARLAERAGVAPRALLLKISPDLWEGELEDMLGVAGAAHLDGIIATNTSAGRPAQLAGVPWATESGGLSGRLLRERSTEVIRQIHRKTGGTLPILGVGGVFTAEDAWEKLAAGAAAVQLYTGLIYQGPRIVSEIARGLSALLDSSGAPDLRAARGA